MKNKKEVADIVESTTTHGKNVYHTFEEIGVTGVRDNSHRVDQFNIPDLKDKTVLDIGCNSGWFCVHALKQGAKRVVGIDKADTIIGAKEAAEYLGYKDKIDYYAVDGKALSLKQLQSLTGEDEFDVVFFFSMFNVLGIPEILKIGKLVIMENNNMKNTDGIIKLMKKDFSVVTQKGKTEDFGVRAIIKATR